MAKEKILRIRNIMAKAVWKFCSDAWVLKRWTKTGSITDEILKTFITNY